MGSGKSGMTLTQDLRFGRLNKPLVKRRRAIALLGSLKGYPARG